MGSSSPTPSHPHFLCCFRLYLKATHSSKAPQFPIYQGCSCARKKMDSLWEMPFPLAHSLPHVSCMTKDSSGNSHHFIWASRFLLESTGTHKTQDHIPINCSRQANCMLDKCVQTTGLIFSKNQNKKWQQRCTLTSSEYCQTFKNESMGQPKLARGLSIKKLMQELSYRRELEEIKAEIRLLDFSNPVLMPFVSFL